MASVNQNRIAASRRLMKDFEETQKFPVANISAVPLDDNLFEWHCCVVASEVNFHVILYFPDDYPNSGPSADFFPIGLRIRSGASMQGKKGMKFCLSFLADYKGYHGEWKRDVGYGWGPSGTVQALLMNICAALSEFNLVELNKDILEDNSLKCADCGHSCDGPFPPLPQITEQTTLSPHTNPVISCYFSRDTYRANQTVESIDGMFGFGIEIRGHGIKQYLASPCETLTFGSFQRMKEDTGFAQTSIKEEVTGFLPLYIHPSHGECIKALFESRVEELCKDREKARARKFVYTMAEKIIDILPNLMATTVEDFTMALEGNGELLNGFFSLHRLLLWACKTYPGLQEIIDQRIQSFIDDEKNRLIKNCPFTEEWLMLLAVSRKYRWEDVAEKYITEVWNRKILCLAREEKSLVNDCVSTAVVLDNVFKLTSDLNKRIALQVIFLTVACPMGWTHEDVISRYDNNLGLPTNEMIHEVRDGLKSARDSKSFADWFKIWKFEPETDEEIRLRLVETVQFNVSTAGYSKRSQRYTWKRLIQMWKAGKDMSILKKLAVRPSAPVANLPVLCETQLPIERSPSLAGPSTTESYAPTHSSNATCCAKVDETQELQPMDTTESSDSAECVFNKNLDNTPSARPTLWPSMTMNILADLKEKRHSQIFRKSPDVNRPRRVKSCCVF